MSITQLLAQHACLVSYGEVSSSLHRLPTSKHCLLVGDCYGEVLPPVHCAPADPRVGLLGAMQSLFEGSMYTFVFLWTPALSPDGEHLPHGMIFACFMVSSMAGSALAGRLLAHGSG